MTRFIAILIVVTAIANVRPVFALPSTDLTCGIGPSRVRVAEGMHVHPESCAWNPMLSNGLGEIPGRFMCTNTMFSSLGPADQDFVGWISEFDQEGHEYYREGAGFGSPLGWGPLGNGWSTQCGAGYLSSPLGVAVDPNTGVIYIAEGAKVDHDEDGDLEPSIWVFDPVFDPSMCYPANVIAMNDVVTINDVGLAPDGALYVTDSAFGQPAKSAVYRIADPEFALAADVTKWLSLANYPAPNPLTFGVYDWGSGPESTMFVATLGSVLDPEQPHNGRILRVRMPFAPGAPPQAVVSIGIPSGFYDGIVWVPGGGFAQPGRLVASDLRTAKIYNVDPATGSRTLRFDLSPYAHQLAGLAVGGFPPVMAAATFRHDVLLVGN
jgi:hypothetical protein